LTFEQVLRDPSSHIGSYLLVGGIIVASHVIDGKGSELEIVQVPINNRGRITSTDRSAGRFIALDEKFRDPAVYRPGRLITLVGQVAGSRKGRIDEVDYLYPVLTVSELRLWSPEDYPGSSRLRFGVGIGVGISR
jgi:outer membrane lipoprotein